MTHFLLAVRFGPALHSCLFILHNALPCFLPTLCSTFALPLLICPSAMTCPALYYPALCPVRSCPANSPISGRSDRKVLRLICIYPITLNGYIYSPGKKIEKIKKNRKNLKKLKIIGTISGALTRSLICISSLTSQHVYIGAGTSHRSARSLNCDNFGQEQYFLMR